MHSGSHPAAARTAGSNVTVSSAKNERTRLYRSVRTDAKQTKSPAKRDAEIKNRVRAACWMAEEQNSGPKMVDQATGHWQHGREGTPLGGCRLRL